MENLLKELQPNPSFQGQGGGASPTKQNTLYSVSKEERQRANDSLGFYDETQKAREKAIKEKHPELAKILFKTEFTTATRGGLAFPGFLSNTLLERVCNEIIGPMVGTEKVCYISELTIYQDLILGVILMDKIDEIKEDKPDAKFFFLPFDLLMKIAGSEDRIKGLIKGLIEEYDIFVCSNTSIQVLHGNSGLFAEFGFDEGDSLTLKDRNWGFIGDSDQL